MQKYFGELQSTRNLFMLTCNIIIKYGIIIVRILVEYIIGNTILIINKYPKQVDQLIFGVNFKVIRRAHVRFNALI